jgi:hypothetical protein
MSEDEILGKIELEHQNGQHLTGPQAGCRLCEKMALPTPEPVGSRMFRNVLRETIESEGGNLSDLDVPPRHTPDDVVRSLYGDPVEGDLEPDDLALAAMQAIDAARESLKRLGRLDSAEMHVGIGIVYAILAVDETLQALLGAFEVVPQDEAEGDLHSNAGVHNDGEAPGTPLPPFDGVVPLPPFDEVVPPDEAA